MKRYIYKYRKFDPYLRPVIPIALRFGNKESRLLALIDSGADLNIFSKDICRLFGNRSIKMRNSRVRWYK